MNSLFLHTNQTKNITILQNQFIDQYMAPASGEYVKLYLYLLRCAQAEEQISFTAISDLLDHTERDIKRALGYWERLGLIRLTKNKDGWITDITFLDIPFKTEEEKEEGEEEAPKTDAPKQEDSSADSAAVPSSSSKTAVEAPETVHHRPFQEFPEAKNFSPQKLAFFQSKEEIRQLFFIAEQYLGKTLDSTEMSALLYFYDSLHFSVDLIEYLIEYCVSKGGGNCRYMKKVAMSWAAEGITTVAEAKQSVTVYSKHYFSILRAFGIRGRNPIDSEIECMSRWLKEYNMPIELVIEACHRTIDRIHQPQFSYTEKILSAWKENGIKDMDQLKAYEEQKKQKHPAAAPTACANRFNNFQQRQYDFNQLEKQLLSAEQSSADSDSQEDDAAPPDTSFDESLEIPK
ncbi:MAG: DnaD domain protein [Lachnospiraceae bacterium]|nr:DnaD domain protein [Lachnospiraceae bacterium]